MPLRDHFHPPLKDQDDWESFHSAWANTIVRRLNSRWLSRPYRSAPQVHLGALVEVDVATFEENPRDTDVGGSNGGVATAVWAPPRPAVSVAVDLPAQDVFEVRVYEERRGRRLVAVVELVSPGNKDRTESRQAFAVKCAAYLQQQVSLVVVDVVTDRLANLHAELIELLRFPTPPVDPDALQLYAVAYHSLKDKDSWRLDLWPEQLTLGTPLPTMPLWLASNLAVPLELELTYEETCQVLRIP
ncbi:MAG TPA: DUF4058 family protein [Gemmataceae bacterium]|jgi:hypothetical protein